MNWMLEMTGIRYTAHGARLGSWEAEKKIGYFFLHYDFLQPITDTQ
jgi:hypothetical protein